MGWVLDAMVPTKDDDRRFLYSGVTIPWRDGKRLTRVKIRRFPNPDITPKYAEAYSDRPRIYPDPAVIRIGEPLVICEGEFDAMLLGQQLPEASVITLGSAGARTDLAVLSRMLASPRWFAALDADKASDSAASKFPARAIRVRPPDKDWEKSTERERTASVTTGDATYPCPRAGSNWNPCDGDRPSSVLLTGFKPPIPLRKPGKPAFRDSRPFFLLPGVGHQSDKKRSIPCVYFETTNGRGVEPLADRLQCSM